MLLFVLFLSVGLVASQNNAPSPTVFLVEFGYLESITTSRPLLREAIENFQLFIGIPVTGDWDTATRAAAVRPRCGVSDRNTTDMRTWPTNRITFRFENYTNDVAVPVIRTAVIDAFSAFERVSAVQFHEETSLYKNADIKISFRFLESSPLRDTITGFWLPGSNEMVFNDRQFWSSSSVFGVDLTKISLHLIGHALGLGHSNVSVMSPLVNNWGLTADDITRIQILYGENPCSPTNPCKNGGRCTKNLSRKGYECLCVSGWKGKTCSKDSGRGKTVCRALNIPNGQMVPSGRVGAWDNVLVSCNTGFHLVGVETFKCTTRGNYQPHPRNTQCVQNVMCPSPQLLNGTVYPATQTRPLTVITFRCNEGFQLQGFTYLTCETNGQLNGAQPTCIPEPEEPEPQLSEDCPQSLDALVSRSISDRLVFAFYENKYWIFKRKEASGGLKPFAQQATLTSLTFPSELGKIDAAFSYSVNGSRYFCFISGSLVHFVGLKTLQKIDQTENVERYFGITEQITAAARWDKDTVLFFTENWNYHRHSMVTGATSEAERISQMFPSLPENVPVIAAGKTFTEWSKTALLLLENKNVYEVAKSDGHVLSTRSFSSVFHNDLEACSTEN